MKSHNDSSWKTTAGAIVLMSVAGLTPMVIGGWLFGPPGVGIGCGVGMASLVILGIFGNWIYEIISKHLFPLVCAAIGSIIKKKEKQQNSASHTRIATKAAKK